MEKATRFSTREALEAISEWVAHVDPGEWESLSESELLEVMRRARKTADRVTALAGLITAAVERRNAAIQVAGVPLNTLIAQEEHRDGKDATRAVLQGRELARNPQVGKAVLDGVITAEHARGVVKAMGELPHEVTRLQAEQISSILVGQAQHSTPSQLPGKAKEALRKVAPELVPSPDDEDRLLAEQRRIALRRRSFTFGDDNEGSVWLKGSLPHLEAEPLLTTLHQLVAAGKRAERDKPRGNGVTEATREQRYADALIQLAATSGGGGARRRQPATVVVTVREEDLHAKARAAGILASGQQIPAGGVPQAVVRGADSARCARWELGDPGRRHRSPFRHPRHPTNPHPPRWWMRLPRLHRHRRGMRCPSRAPLEAWWHHGTRQSRVALPASSWARRAQG